MTEKGAFLVGCDRALLVFDLQPEVAFDEGRDVRHHPLARRLRPHVDDAVVGVAAEAMAPLFQVLVEIVEQQLCEHRRERATFWRTLVPPDHHTTLHHPRIEDGANDLQEALFADTSRQAGHHHIVVDPVSR